MVGGLTSLRIAPTPSLSVPKGTLIDRSSSPMRYSLGENHSGRQGDGAGQTGTERNPLYPSCSVPRLCSVYVSVNVTV